METVTIREADSLIKSMDEIKSEMKKGFEDQRIAIKDLGDKYDAQDKRLFKIETYLAFAKWLTLGGGTLFVFKVVETIFKFIKNTN